MSLDANNAQTDSVSRPRGLTIVAIVEVLLGIFALFGGVVHLLFGIGGLVTYSGSNVSLGNLANGLGDLFSVEGLVLIISAVGIWKLARWGWKLSVAIIVIGIATSIPVLALGSVGAVPALIVNGVLVYYLTRRPIKSRFRG